MRLALILSSCFLFALACQSEGRAKAEGSTTDEPPAPTYDPQTAEPSATSQAVTKPMVPKPNLNRPILVGGCLDVCDEPRRALSGFFAAVQSGKVEKVKPYINSARLIHSGERLGEAWANLYRQRKLGERNESIKKWLKRWLGWVDRISDPAERARLGTGVEIVEENQKRLVVLYRHPDFAPDPKRDSGPKWRIVFAPRGLEWLVSEIDEQPKG